MIRRACLFVFVLTASVWIIFAVVAMGVGMTEIAELNKWPRWVASAFVLAPGLCMVIFAGYVYVADARQTSPHGFKE